MGFGRARLALVTKLSFGPRLGCVRARPTIGFAERTTLATSCFDLFGRVLGPEQTSIWPRECSDGASLAARWPEAYGHILCAHVEACAGLLWLSPNGSHVGPTQARVHTECRGPRGLTERARAPHLDAGMAQLGHGRPSGLTKPFDGWFRVQFGLFARAKF